MIKKNTRLICKVAHPHGNFTVDNVYKVDSHRLRDVPGGGLEYAGVRVRDDRRQRKDFNFIPESPNFIWDYFSLTDM